MMAAFCVAVITAECDADKPNKENRNKVIIPIQVNKNTHLFIPL